MIVSKAYYIRRRTCMKIKFYFWTSILLLSFVMFHFDTVSAKKSASKGYFNDYKTIAGIDRNSDFTCAQAMCIDRDTNTAYCIKITGDESYAQIYSINLKKHKVKTLTNEKTDEKYCNYLYHANDMEIIDIKGTKYLYIVTLQSDESKPQLIKLKLSGSKYKKVASYKIQTENEKTCNVSGISFVEHTDQGNVFLFKKGSTLYKGLVKPKLKNKSIITLYDSCKLNLANSKVNGKVIPNIKEYTSQSLNYYCGKVYTPYSYENVSVVFVFDIDANLPVLPANKDGNEDLSFRITSKTYDFFEIESCAISKDGKLYFNTNRSDNYDPVAYFGKKFDKEKETIYTNPDSPDDFIEDSSDCLTKETSGSSELIQ